MERKCYKCKNTITSDDFICPHCGAIIGDPIAYAAALKTQKSKNSYCIRWTVAAMLVIALIAVVCTIGWCVRSYFRQQTPTISTAPTTIPTQPQTTAPLTVYTARFKTEAKTDLSGSVAHVYLDEQLIYSGEVDKNGDVTFILPEREGYSIRLTELPVQYQVNYNDAIFSFAEGERYLYVTLEEKPVPYTVKIVNRAGEPLPGTGITFYSSGKDPQQQITDDTGCCTFMADYATGNCSAYVLFAPNGYIPNSSAGFASNSLEATITLWTYEEMGFASDDIYTVQVVDEFDAPISNVSLSVVGKATDVDADILGTNVSGTTNMDGCFTFVGYGSMVWEIKILKNTDYYDTVFHFDAGIHQMRIQLELIKPPGTKYTYTISFMDYTDHPVAGVEIAYQPPDRDEAQHYVSDENGIITFQTYTAEPTAVQYYITRVPDGYYTNRPDNTAYSFLPYQRSTFVRLFYDGEVVYTVYVVDDVGQSVPSAELFIWKNHALFGKIVTDEEGKAQFRNTPASNWDFTIQSLPEPYSYYGIKNFEYGDDHCIYITIEPNPNQGAIPDQGDHDE